MGSIAKIGYLFYILGFLFCYFKRLIIKLSTKDRNKELRSLEVQKSRPKGDCPWRADAAA